MRTKLMTTAVVAFSLLSTAATAGTHVGWYVAADAGVHQTAAQHVTITDATLYSRDPAASSGSSSSGAADPIFPEGPAVAVTGSDYTMKTKPGGMVLGRVGYQMTPHWRVEGEFGHRAAKVKDIGAGHINIDTTMLNALYDFSPESDLHPFVGLGIGQATVKTTLKGSVNQVTIGGYDMDVVYKINSKKTNTAWQAIAGATWALSDRLSLDLTYRWLDAGKVSYDITADSSYDAPLVETCAANSLCVDAGKLNGSTTARVAPRANEVGVPSVAALETDILRTSAAKVRDQSITLGLRWAFGVAAAPPPPVTVTEPSDVAMPEAPVVDKPIVDSYGPQVPGKQSFTVYFNFDKSNLTTEARQVVNSAAQYALSAPSPSVTVTGHTDTSGSQAYNVRLSEKRANAVASGLTDAGVSASAIKIGWTGESDLAIPTKNGVKHPENRRTTIDVTF